MHSSVKQVIIEHAGGALREWQSRRVYVALILCWVCHPTKCAYELEACVNRKKVEETENKDHSKRVPSKVVVAHRSH